jgi:hypothetical protein
MTNELTTNLAKSSAAFLDIADTATGIMLPTIKVTDKIFTPAPGNDPTVLDLLPDNGKAKPAIYIGYRVGALSWKNGYDKKTDDETPAFAVFAKPQNDDDIGLIAGCSKARQMCPKLKQPSFDFEASKVGHVKPLMEILVYMDKVGFMVVGVSPNYYNVVDGIKAVRSLQGPVAVMIKPDTKPHKGGGYNWDSAFCGVEPISGDNAVKLLASFEEYRTKVSEDLVLKDAVEGWLQCSDRPMTDAVREALKAGIALNPPQF